MSRPSYKSEWTEHDFDSLSWHDNRVHGMRICNPKDAYDFDLLLDIDYILDWIKTGDGRLLQFVVAPAVLTFHGVDKLLIDVSLSYREEFTIDEIRRSDVGAGSKHKAGSHGWHIALQSIAGRPNRICFEAQGFTQRLTKGPRGPSTSQSLEDEVR